MAKKIARAKITSKSQTTVPKEVRQALGVSSGDTLAFEIDGDAVRVRKETPLDVGYLQSVEQTLSEWESPEDCEAYDDM